MNRSDPTDLAHWFAYGIDAIGRGDYDGGVAMWEESLADDYSFKFTFYPGGRQWSARARSALSRSSTAGRGYVPTSPRANFSGRDTWRLSIR